MVQIQYIKNHNKIRNTNMKQAQGSHEDNHFTYQLTELQNNWKRAFLKLLDLTYKTNLKDDG